MLAVELLTYTIVISYVRLRAGILFAPLTDDADKRNQLQSVLWKS